MGTPKTLSNPIGQKFRAGFTELDSPIDEGRYLFEWWREGPLGILPMVFPAKDMDEPNEDLDILFLPPTQGHEISPSFYLEDNDISISAESALTWVKDSAPSWGFFP